MKDNKVPMIIKGLFRRYERWNPVHPTHGSFWGMGVGIGCGVGWGPGFGPEVIGYVGAGCGVGFSVGITIAGFGIGLPANILTNTPLKVINNAGDEWNNNISSQLRSLQNMANENISHLKDLGILKKGTEIFDLKNTLTSQRKSISESFRLLKKDFSESYKDIKD